MIVLGLDPGATTGWVAYDAVARRVIDSGEFREHHLPRDLFDIGPREIAIERPKGYGPTRPQLVDCGIVFGRILGEFEFTTGWVVHELTRHEVCKILTDATHGEVRVRNDSTAWAALVLLHGEGSDRKPKRKKGVVVETGGAIGSVTGHARAALAVAVAWSLRQEQQQEKSA